MPSLQTSIFKNIGCGKSFDTSQTSRKSKIFYQFASEFGVSENGAAFPYPFLMLAEKLISTKRVSSQGHFLVVGHGSKCAVFMKVETFV